jgi:hypothetical protein
MDNKKKFKNKENPKKNPKNGKKSENPLFPP